MEHQYKDAYENTSPPNLREDFEIAEINLKSNQAEEETKYRMYDEDPYVPEQNPRSVNVVDRIKEGVPYSPVEDTFVTLNQLRDELENFECDCGGSGDSGGSNPDITPEDPDGDGVIEY